MMDFNSNRRRGFKFLSSDKLFPELSVTQATANAKKQGIEQGKEEILEPVRLLLKSIRKITRSDGIKLMIDFFLQEVE